MRKSLAVKPLLCAAAFGILLSAGGYAVGAQGFTEQHEQEHRQREAEAYSNGLKDGSLIDGLADLDRIYLSSIKDLNTREKEAAKMREKNNAEKLARLESSREIMGTTALFVVQPNGDMVAVKRIHERGPLSN